VRSARYDKGTAYFFLPDDKKSTLSPYPAALSGAVSAQQHVAVPHRLLIPGRIFFASIPGRVLGQEELGILARRCQDKSSILLEDAFPKLEFCGPS